MAPSCWLVQALMQTLARVLKPRPGLAMRSRLQPVAPINRNFFVNHFKVCSSVVFGTCVLLCSLPPGPRSFSCPLRSPRPGPAPHPGWGPTATALPGGSHDPHRRRCWVMGAAGRGAGASNHSAVSAAAAAGPSWASDARRPAPASAPPARTPGRATWWTTEAWWTTSAPAAWASPGPSA